METRLTLENLKWLGLSFAFVSLSIFFSYRIFPSQASVLTITFVVAGLTPLIHKALGDEEAVVAHGEGSFFEKYGGIVMMMLTTAVGMFLAFSFWYAVLPSDPSYAGRCGTPMPCREGIFALQMAHTGERDLGEMFGLVVLSFALSLFFGVGAILIIAWDLSLLVTSSSAGPAAFIGYLPQLSAFFLTGLAGALLSFAILRHEWRSRGFLVVVRDASGLLLASLLLILVFYFL